MASRALACSKLSAVLLTLLPTLLLIPSFVLAAVALASKDWTRREEYNTATGGRMGRTQRGPFITCETGETPHAPQVCARVRTPAGWCNAAANSYPENPHFCGQLALGGRLLYAGTALAGAALLFALILTASTLLRSRHRRGSGVGELLAWLALLAKLCAAFAGLLLLLGTFITTNTLVNIQYPVGNWFAAVADPGTDPVKFDSAGPYLIGKAVGECAAAAVLAGTAAGMMGLVWDSPRVGVGAGEVRSAAEK
jgi:hypothetical protein